MSIRVLHTSDWHLGKKLYKKDRLYEQELFLNWLFDIIKEKNIDLLIIAGDIFDVPTPPNNALKLYYDFLEKVTSQTECIMVLISGNHDSKSFIEAPKKILKKFSIRVFSRLSKDYDQNTFVLNKDNKSIEIKALPYFKSYDLNNLIEKNPSETTKEDYLYALSEISNDWKIEDSFKIILSHHAFGSFISSESEHVLTMAGLESIPLNTVTETCDYLALGHIHKPQRISDKAYYSGSPIPLRFSETHAKEIKLLNISHSLELENIEVPIFRELISLKTTKDDIFDKIKLLKTYKIQAWAEIHVIMDSPDHKLIDQIKKELESKNIDLLSYYPHYSEALKENVKEEYIMDKTIDDIFDMYYQSKFPTSKTVPQKLKVEFHNLLNHHEN